jgi:iron(III) transport system ATP-binding protein
LDEPFSNLDITLAERIRQELKPIFQQLNMSIILVTHHRADAAFLADKVVDFHALLKN